MKNMMMLLVAALAFNAANAQDLSQSSPDYVRGDAFLTTTSTGAIGVNAAVAASAGSIAIAASMERRFLLKELSEYHLIAVFPSPAIAFGCSLSYSGDAIFNLMNASFIAAKKLSDKVQVGTTIGFSNLTAMGYGHAAAVTAAVAVIWSPTTRFHYAINFANPGGTSITEFGRLKTPTQISSGIGFDVSADLGMQVEIIATESLPVRLLISCRFQLPEKMQVKVGYSSARNLFAGIGISFKKCALDFAGAWNPVNGFTPLLIISFPSVHK